MISRLSRLIGQMIMLAAALCCCGACYQPDYPQTHRCSAAQPGCPAGQRCSGTTCVPEGQTPDSAPDLADAALPVTDALDAAPAPDVGSKKVVTHAGSTAGHKDGPLAAALFSSPTKVAMDGAGKLYVADSLNHRIRVISGGQVSTLAGSGAEGMVDGAALSATFREPYGIAVDSSGTVVYVADRQNHAIRVISGGQVYVLAGDGTPGLANGTKGAARFNEPCGVAVDDKGTLYVADRSNNMIRAITSSGEVTSFAGDGTPGEKNGAQLSAQFNAPYGLTVSKAGSVIFVADSNSHMVRRIAGGQVTTLAGTGESGYQDGPAGTAKLSAPTDVALGPLGAVFVTDRGNQRIRRIAGGQVTTLAGKGTPGMLDGPLLSALFHKPNGLVVGAGGMIYVADRMNNRIRRVIP